MRMSRLVMVSMIVWGWGLGCDSPVKNMPASEESPVSVSTERVEQVQIPVVVTAVGTTQPYAQATPATRLMGQITAVDFDEGDQVQQGQVLVRIEDGDLQAKRQQAESGLQEAQAVLANAQKRVRRMRNLYEQDAVPQQNLDEAETGYARAKAAVRAATEGIKEVEAHLRYTAIAAPLDGVVVRKFVQPGDVASPGMPLFAVEQQDPIKITLQIGERDLAMVQVNQQVEVEIKAIDKVVTARVEAVIPVADPGSRTFQVKVVAANADGVIGSGMFARVHFTKEMRSALLVSAKAVVRRGQLEGVYALADGKARLRWVRLGKILDGRIEVLSGLDAGERVVVAGLENVQDGQRVEVGKDE